MYGRGDADAAVSMRGFLGLLEPIPRTCAKRRLAVTPRGRARGSSCSSPRGRFADHESSVLGSYAQVRRYLHAVGVPLRPAGEAG